jgi:hypothetical protein
VPVEFDVAPFFEREDLDAQTFGLIEQRAQGFTANFMLRAEEL